MELSTDKKTTNAWIAIDHGPATGIPDGQWNTLIADGKVERQGEKRRARYQAFKTGSEE